MQDEMARLLTKFSNDDLAQLFEDTIKAFLEYRDRHGYTEEAARGRAVCDMVDSVRAINDIDQFKADQE